MRRLYSDRRFIRPYDKPSFIHTQRWGLNREHPLSRGLVLSWLLNELSGGTVFDLTGNDNHAIDSAGGINWGTNGLLDGSHNIRVSSPNNMPTGTSPYTLFAGIRVGNEISDNNWIFSYDDTDPAWGTRVTEAFTIYDGGYIAGYSYGLSVRDATVAWVRESTDASGTKNYFNGSLAATLTHSASLDSPGFLTLGNDGYSYDKPIYYLHFYNRALTAGEIAWLHREPYCMIHSQKMPRYFVAKPTVGTWVSDLKIPKSIF